MAISALGRLTSHPGLKTGLRTRFRDSQPTINWAAKPLNRTIFRRVEITDARANPPTMGGSNEPPFLLP